MRNRIIGMKQAISSVRTAVFVKSLQYRAKMKENTGEGYIDTAVFS